MDFICGIKSNSARMRSPNVSSGPRGLTENNQGHLKQPVILDCVQSVSGPRSVLKKHTHTHTHTKDNAVSRRGAVI